MTKAEKAGPFQSSGDRMAKGNFRDPERLEKKKKKHLGNGREDKKPTTATWGSANTNKKGSGCSKDVGEARGNGPSGPDITSLRNK